MFEEANKIFPRNQEERESIEKMIDEASSSDEIVKLLRKGLELETCIKLIKKAMDIEEETLEGRNIADYTEKDFNNRSGCFH